MDDKEIKLYIKLFNNLDIMCNGRSLFEEHHLTAKLKSLLQYMIINRGTPCKLENIIAELWPHNEQAERKKVLQTYVHRLRNAIAKKNAFDYDFSSYFTIINNKGNYQMEIADDVEFDTDVFTALVSEASEVSEYDDLMSLTSKLSALYDGHYLSDCRFENMVKRQQNYYLQNYCTAMVSILEKLEAMEKYEDIISLCEKFFAIEDLNDAINTIFIRALIKTQQNTYAIRHYDYIDKKTRDAFGINPSKEMSELYKELKGSPGPATSKSNFDESQIKDLISYAVSSHMKDERGRFALARIHFTFPTSFRVQEEFVAQVVKRALRKNDMYAQVGKYTVMAILNEAKEEQYENIKRRIQSDIKANYGEMNKAKVEIAVWAMEYVI